MLCKNEFFEFREAFGGGFQNEEDFAGAFDLALPAVMGFDFWDEIGAGDQPGIEGPAGEGAGGSQIRRCDQDNGKTGGFHTS